MAKKPYYGRYEQNIANVMGTRALPQSSRSERRQLARLNRKVLKLLKEQGND